jgi:hypothetical protein
MIAIVEMVFTPGKNGCAMPAALMDSTLGRKMHAHTSPENLTAQSHGSSRRMLSIIFFLPPCFKKFLLTRD